MLHFKKKLIALLLLSPMVFGEMQSLKEFISSVEELGDKDVLYGNQRCLALFAMMINVSNDSPDESMQEINNLVLNAFDEVLEPTYAFWQLVGEGDQSDDPDKSYEAFMENLRILLPPIISEYEVLSNDNLAKNGNYFTGNELITGDLEICNTLVRMERDAREIARQIREEIESEKE